MRLPLATAAICTLLSVAGCAGKPAAELRAEEPWVRLAAVAGRPAAAYFVLRGGATADRLTGIESPAAARAELHEGGMMDNMATMKPMSGVDVAADGRATFAPGGDHVMLFGVDPAIKPGGTMPLHLHFRSGATLDAAARVIAAGDPAPSLEHD
jgi:copper(I)-binding protein